VTGLNAKARFPDLNALRLGVRDRHNQRDDAQHHQDQACKQQDFHIASPLSVSMDNRVADKKLILQQQIDETDSAFSG
jgi:hypothetical protein